MGFEPGSFPKNWGRNSDFWPLKLPAGTLRSKCDRAMLAVLRAVVFDHSELLGFAVKDVQLRETGVFVLVKCDN